MSDLEVDPREYCKMRYAAPQGACKCGKCQLVPMNQLIEWSDQIEHLGLEHEHACQEVAVAIAERDAVRKQLVKFRKALAWIDNTDPEIVAAAESKFGFSLTDEERDG